MLSSAGLPTTSTLSLPFALCVTFSEAPPLASAPMFGCKVSREGGGEGGLTHHQLRILEPWIRSARRRQRDVYVVALAAGIGKGGRALTILKVVVTVL